MDSNKDNEEVSAIQQQEEENIGTGRYKTRSRKKISDNNSTPTDDANKSHRRNTTREKMAREDSKHVDVIKKEEPTQKKRNNNKRKAEESNEKVAEKRARGTNSKSAAEKQVKVQEDVKPDVNGKDAESKPSVKPKANTASNKNKKKNGEDEPIPRPVKYESLGDGPPPVPSTGQKYMGCHVSGAGGVWNAFANAEECSAKSFALFLRSQRQWVAKPLEDETVNKWKEVSKECAPHLVLPHGSYLMNLGSSSEETLIKSRNLLVEEMKRCQRLGIPHFNFHPGSTLGKRSRVECCKLIADGINLAHRQTEGVICVLENMCCQGFTVGGDFHELRSIIEHVEDRSRIGVCLDTCHAHAAGYDLSTEKGFQELLDDFEKIIGWQFLRGLHINDSKGKTGDHLDRHENIGKGTIGIEGFRRVMNCEYFNDIPLILETPWTSNEGYGKEIKVLESLIQK
ncbi:hypothetical protein Pcinc_018648 [Petrolisthes cinctipes]|uniref:Xylose isomerase-like TIM barrel domain-containing protein n=1 Tax=Petrolisthes cinctipes TaxID=88211 RepID=A0AAE1FLT1_PETCI|nr:hypothetical protein Pcinc_018648 [Petrolisthes cinctipes]